MEKPGGEVHTHASMGQAVLVKKGEAIPANAVPMEDKDVLALQLTRIEKFKPQSEMRMFTWGVGGLSSSVAISSLIINNLFRQNFKLGGLGKMRTYIPVVGISTLVSLGIHEFGVKHKILLGKEGCPLCVSLRSGAYQVGVGLLYPYLMSLLTCLPLAREYYTLPLPSKGSGGLVGYLRLFRQVSPSPPILLMLGILHAAVGMKVANTELKLFHKHLSHSPSLSEMPLDLPMKKL